MGTLLTLFYISFIIFLIYRYKNLQPPGIKLIYVSFYFILKCAIGIALGLFYKQYYGGGDTFGYYYDSSQLFSLLFNDPISYLRILTGLYADSPEIIDHVSILQLWNSSGFDDYYNDARTLLKVNSIIRIISFGYYDVHVVWMNFLSYLGLLWLYKVFIRSDYENESRIPLIKLIPFLLPSVLIWGSGLLKEPLIILFLGALFRTFQLLVTEGRIRFLVLSIVLMFTFIFVKTYIIALILPGLIGCFLGIKTHSKKVWMFVPASYIVTLLILFIAGNFNSYFDLPSLLFGKQLNSIRFAIFMHAGSYVHPVAFAPSIVSFLKHFPEAAWFTIARPYPTELPAFWMFPFSIEWIFLLVIICWSILNKSIVASFSTPKAWMIFCTAVGILAIVGFTNPVLGNTVRYRLSGALLLGLSFVVSVDKRKVNLQSPNQ
jgi:hypothetical protein